MPDHRKWLSRIVWQFNHSEDRDAWCERANAAGYRLERETRAHHDEVRFSYEGQVVGLMHQFDDGEAFLFVFEPEARAPWMSRAWWRITHPFTPLRELPWPRREVARS